METEKMTMKQEMINDAMDDAMDHDSDAEDELVKQVMDEVGLDFSGKLVDAPTKQKQVDTQDDVDHDLQARLNNLKR